VNAPYVKTFSQPRPTKFPSASAMDKIASADSGGKLAHNG
jgi:hypothetical protein